MGNYKRWRGSKLKIIAEAIDNNLESCVIAEAFGVETSTMNKIMVRHGIRKPKSKPGKPRSSIACDGYQPNRYRDKIVKDRIVMAEILKKYNLRRDNSAEKKEMSIICGNEYMTSKSLQVIRECEKKAREDKDSIVYITDDLMENWARAHGIQFSKLRTFDGIRYVIAGTVRTQQQFLFLVNQKRVDEFGLLPFHVESFF